MVLVFLKSDLFQAHHERRTSTTDPGQFPDQSKLSKPTPIPDQKLFRRLRLIIHILAPCGCASRRQVASPNALLSSGQARQDALLMEDNELQVENNHIK
jgi:hypothetical protein